jgi:hypothetical protein
MHLTHVCLDNFHNIHRPSLHNRILPTWRIPNSEQVHLDNYSNWDIVCWNNCLNGPAQNLVFSKLEVCGCADWDDVCYENCLDRRESNAFPCGLIIACQKQLQHPMCKAVPTTIPSRCSRSTNPYPRTTTPRSGPTKPSTFWR